MTLWGMLCLIVQRVCSKRICNWDARAICCIVCCHVLLRCNSTAARDRLAHICLGLLLDLAGCIHCVLVLLYQHLYLCTSSTHSPNGEDKQYATGGSARSSRCHVEGSCCMFDWL